MLERIKCFLGFHSWITQYKERCCHFGFTGWLMNELCVNCGKSFSVFQTDEIKFTDKL